MKMKTFRLLFSALAFLTAASLSAAAATSTLTVAITAQNGSGQTGTATLTQDGSDVNVVIALEGPVAPASSGTGTSATTPEPAHIHDGTCADLKGVVYPLTNVVGGSSTTVVKGVTIDKLLGGTYAINVHESAANLGKYVACGNIVAK
jgi:hypothetical protein